MKEITLWNDLYRDIGFEIKRFPASEELDPNKKWGWCYYIYIWASQFGEQRDIVIPRHYYTAFGSRIEVEPKDSFARKIEFHGGCTYYRVEHQNEWDTLIKIGCDYQHLWDEGWEYGLQHALSEVHETIDSLHNYFPNLLKHSDIVDEFRKKFPCGETEHRFFNHLGAPIEFEY